MPFHRQPDQRTCGASVLVTAAVVAGALPAPDLPTFTSLVTTSHRRLTSLTTRGRVQLPWPRALGTPPWSLARGLSDLTGRRYRLRWVRGGGDLAGRLLGHDVAVALYVGNRWLPRHVVLVLPTADGPLAVYDPGRGRLVHLSLADLAGGWRLSGWGRAWFLLAPR